MSGKVIELKPQHAAAIREGGYATGKADQKAVAIDVLTKLRDEHPDYQWLLALAAERIRAS